MSEWKTKRIKDFLSFCSGDTLTSEMLTEDGDYPVYGGNGIRGTYSRFNRDGNYILVGRVGALCGNIHNVYGKFWATEHALIGTPIGNFETRWLSYLLYDMKLGRYSIASAQPVLSISKIARLELPVPPLSEQETIAAYLDKECERIGRKIGLLERKADAYRRLRRSLINQTVTRGLNPNVALKPSQSSICTKIPSHWQESRIKDIFTEKSIKGYPNEPMLCATQSKGVIPQSLYENRIVVALSGLDNMKLVEVGNFVISLRSFQGGIEYAYYRGIISAAYTILELDNNNDREYFRYFFKSSSLIKLMKKCVTGIREGQNINYQILKYEWIPIPPLEEQQEIAAYLDEKCAKIDTIIEKINSQIERLKELKRSLINEVVTGRRAINADSYALD